MQGVLPIGTLDKLCVLAYAGFARAANCPGLPSHRQKQVVDLQGPMFVLGWHGRNRRSPWKAEKIKIAIAHGAYHLCIA